MERNFYYGQALIPEKFLLVVYVRVAGVIVMHVSPGIVCPTHVSLGMRMSCHAASVPLPQLVPCTIYGKFSCRG